MRPLHLEDVANSLSSPKAKLVDKARPRSCEPFKFIPHIIWPRLPSIALLLEERDSFCRVAVLFPRNPNQARMVHQDHHHLHEIVRLSPVVCIGAMQFINVMRLDLGRVFVAPDLSYVGHVTPIIGLRARLEFLVSVALKIALDQRLKVPLNRLWGRFTPQQPVMMIPKLG